MLEYLSSYARRLCEVAFSGLELLESSLYPDCKLRLRKMLTSWLAVYAASAATTATASIVGGRDALPFVNHFIGTNDGSMDSHTSSTTAC